MKTSCLAGCLAVSLVGVELCEFKEIRFVDDRTTSARSHSTDGLAWNPHTHFEFDTEVRATTASPILASGNQHAEEMFRLFIHPDTSGFKLVAYPISLRIDGTPPQMMHGFRPSVEALTEVLSSELGLPTSQIEDIRRTGVAGGVQEIGGSHSPATRHFRRSQLERAGMNFRLPDSV
jgi:hypothetical protein